MKALRVFDGKKLAMGKAWLTMNNLEKIHFQVMIPTVFANSGHCRRN